ncbi:TraX protein [Anaerocolumna jejuensis DSM 15929]|uniref:TraX protein n=1 Tax=Anaerocolumna jejuensis DSM 15929 TaxID=1121322 RepID=A0A1M6TT81_9FIRM|nr:TraX family protein [Anaerocolumna jejuensis]SHK60157.1 TraX protein [Anaerocolumna jejuensis DSM 15929]
MEDITAVPSFPEERIKKRGIPGSTLKLIAIFVMLIDHIAATILDRTLITRGFYNMGMGTEGNAAASNLLNMIDGIMRMIGRLGFPLFCFLLVEGFVHTSNKRKYAIRLGIFALISEIPFDLAFSGKVFNFGYQNVFFTLLIGFLVMWGFQLVGERLKDKKWLPILSIAGAAGVGFIVFTSAQSIMFTVNSILLGFTGRDITPAVPYQRLLFIGMAVVAGIVLLIAYLKKNKEDRELEIFLADCTVLVAGILLANLLITDYSGFGVLTIAVMYALRRKPALSGLGGYLVLNIMSLSELTAIFAIIPIGLYNGERGLRLKYIFYAFYPVHLFILYLICRAMNII